MENTVNNRYLEKIASWSDEGPRQNRYLEKIALWGQVGQAVKNMAGGAVRTVVRATKSKVPTNLTELGAKAEFMKNVRSEAKIATGQGQVLSQKSKKFPLPSDTKDRLISNRTSFFGNKRDVMGQVKDTGTVSTVKVNGAMKGKTQGYNPPSSNFKEDEYKKYIPKALHDQKRNELINKRIGVARAKVGLGVAGVAGSVGLGYHIANRRNNSDTTQQYQQYYDTAY